MTTSSTRRPATGQRTTVGRQTITIELPSSIADRIDDQIQRDFTLMSFEVFVELAVMELLSRLEAKHPAPAIQDEQPAPRRYPYNRPGERTAAEILGTDQDDDQPLPIELTDDYDDDQIREFRKDLTPDQIARIEQIKAKRAAQDDRPGSFWTLARLEANDPAPAPSQPAPATAAPDAHKYTFEGLKGAQAAAAQFVQDYYAAYGWNPIIDAAKVEKFQGRQYRIAQLNNPTAYLFFKDARTLTAWLADYLKQGKPNMAMLRY